MTNEEWIDLIVDVRNGKKPFDDIAINLKPILDMMLRKYNADVREDLRQCALVKVWKSLNAIDVKRVDTVVGIMVKCIKNGINSELKVYYRQHLQTIDVELINLVTHHEEETFEYKKNKFLAIYIDYIIKFGKFGGSHIYIANRLRMPVRFIKKKFMIEMEKTYGKRETSIDLFLSTCDFWR